MGAQWLVATRRQGRRGPLTRPRRPLLCGARAHTRRSSPKDTEVHYTPALMDLREFPPLIAAVSAVAVTRALISHRALALLLFPLSPALLNAACKMDVPGVSGETASIKLTPDDERDERTPSVDSGRAERPTYHQYLRVAPEDKQLPNCRHSAARKSASVSINMQRFSRDHQGYIRHSPKSNTDYRRVRVKNLAPVADVAAWAESLDQLLECQTGQLVFEDFLRTEYSEENLLFWRACEGYKKIADEAELAVAAKRIFVEFVQVDALRQINIDYHTREQIKRNVKSPSVHCFDDAQKIVYGLMERDSYPRFLRSDIYRTLLENLAADATKG
ncbi:hypothetical protein F2P81_005295 [Scophthalmus maximus]|uniref:RGS domain-containing protein n=1 Tax=Scophthalmus maximus TaxID=52904 RepID=A0A6A4T6V8_SCOMX|nr:hypothetical protein F2P81_005295 [Scophthalmus maximus]